MNKIITLISICFIFLTNSANAQKLEYETTSPWFWGMNIGAAWNTTDVKNRTNYGWGITLGRSLNFDYGNTFSFDIRGRYLGGQWRGQDVDSVGFTVPNKALSSGNTNYDSLLGYGVNNFGTKAHELDLELVIHFNKLVSKTGVDPYIFGGIGLTWYNTRGNLLNEDNGSLYDYYSLDKFSKSSIKGLIDDSYETPLDGSTNNFQVGVMPSLGVGLGYFFSKRFSMGIEHKTTFSLVDHFDGYNNANTNYANNSIFKNDVYHYTNLYFKYYFKHKGESSTTHNPDNTDNNNNVVGGGNGDCQKPIIRITNPGANQTVKDPNLMLKADVAHTASRDNITVTLNGVNTTNFTYSSQTNKLEGTSYLQVGQNTVVVTATNSCGSTSETSYVNYVQDCQTPSVRFTNPLNSGQTVNANTFYITADVYNLAKNEQLIFKVNGVSVSNFSFNTTSSKFSSTINLKEGQNIIELFATNNCGTGSGSTVINYAYNCPAPIIQSINTTSGITVNSSTYNFEAQLKNATSSNQISVKVNGASQGVGQYTTSSGWLKQNLRLNPGQNIIEISVTNNCGTATQTIVINYEVPCVNPTVTITNPSSAGQSVTSPNYSFVGQLTNMNNSSIISLTVNGESLTGFNYNSANGKVTRTIALKQGANTIELKATNNCGTASDITVVNYNYTCPKPTVQLASPVNNPTVTDANYTVEAFVSNITSESQVQLKVNGVVRTGGTYITSNSTYKNTVSLQEGNNTIELMATNTCGSASTFGTINRRAVQTVENPPIIVMTGTCDATVEAGLYYISGSISSVTSGSQVTISVNNSIVNSVTYAPSNLGLNFGFNLPVSLNPDTYVIVVTAQNSGGVITKTCVIKVNKPEEKIKICHIPPGNNGNPQTLEIPLSAWPAHQAHGDQLGECVVVVDPDLTICILENGILTTKIIKQSQWPHYLSLGAKLGKCPEVVDEDIVICIKVNGKPTTLTIKQSQWSAYQAKGATLGKCPEVEEKIKICHIPPGNNSNPQTIEIPLSAWPAHQAHGDQLGECVEPVADEDIVICVQVNGRPTTMTIKKSQWTTYQAKGATLGKCAEVAEMITICHRQNGVAQTLQIPLSDWPAHQAHGDQLGSCREVTVDEDIVICIQVNGKPTTMTIKQSQLAAYQAKGATLGKCPEVIVDATIVICLQVNGKPNTMTIKQSQWKSYQAKGATLGKCPEVVIDEEIVICVSVNGKPTTMSIKQSQWKAYQAKGATLGKCAETNSENNGTSTGGTLPGQLNPDIAICIEENGVLVTKIIKSDELPEYIKLGATEGPCVSQKVKVENGRGGTSKSKGGR